MVLGIAIDVQDLSIEYKSTPKGIMRRKDQKRVLAISNVSMTINKGEVVALIGKNGSGKTTLLSAIGGNLRPASGTLSLIHIGRCRRSTRGRSRWSPYH